MNDDASYDIAITRRGGTRAVPRRRLRDAIEHALRRHGCARAAVAVDVVDDAVIAELNERYLGHDGPTDVLTFDLSDPGGVIDGQIVCSAETAARIARARGRDPDAEIVLYAVHGTLHLLGYDDADAEHARVMHAKEDEMLSELGYGAVYAGGTGRAGPPANE